MSCKRALSVCFFTLFVPLKILPVKMLGSSVLLLSHEMKADSGLTCGGLLVRTSNNFTVICILSFLREIERDFDSILNLVSTQPPPNAPDPDTHYHSRLNKWNGLSSEMISLSPRENFYDSSTRWGFSSSPNGFISHLTALSTLNMSSVQLFPTWRSLRVFIFLDWFPLEGER